MFFLKWFLQHEKHVVYVFPTGFNQGYRIVHDPAAPGIKRTVNFMTLNFGDDGIIELNDDDWDWMGGQFMAPDYRYQDGTRLHYNVHGDPLPPGPFARFFGYRGVSQANHTITEYWYGEIGVKLPD